MNKKVSYTCSVECPCHECKTNQNGYCIFHDHFKVGDTLWFASKGSMFAPVNTPILEGTITGIEINMHDEIIYAVNVPIPHAATTFHVVPCTVDCDGPFFSSHTEAAKFMGYVAK